MSKSDESGKRLEPVVVFAVVFSDYEPTEIDSLWQRREDAEKRCDEANKEALRTSMWHVVEWVVK